MQRDASSRSGSESGAGDGAGSVGGKAMASGLVLILLAVWIFTRTFWGGLPHRLASAVT